MLMIGATVHQNKAYTVPLTTLTSATYKRFTRRFIGVNLLIGGGEIPVTYPFVLIEQRTPQTPRTRNR
jgi:hypothetical protein